jgi:hypothetical protein
VPDVPLHSATEGYNVAFVTCCSATGRINAWRLLPANGKPLPARGIFTLFKVRSRYLFRLDLHWDDRGDINSSRLPPKSSAEIQILRLVRDATRRCVPALYSPARSTVPGLPVPAVSSATDPDSSYKYANTGR